MYPQHQLIITSPHVRSGRLYDVSSMDYLTSYFSSELSYLSPLIIDFDFIKNYLNRNSLLSLFKHFPLLIQYWLVSLLVASRINCPILSVSQEYALPFYFARQSCVVLDLIQLYTPRSFRYKFFYYFYVVLVLRLINHTFSISLLTSRTIAKSVRRFAQCIKISNISMPRSDVTRALLPSKPSILWIGTLSPHKRFTFFLDSLILLSQTTLSFSVQIVVPQSDLETTTERALLLQSLGISVRCISNVTPDDLSTLYSKASIFVSTSLLEGFCLPLREAHFNHCLCIAPNRAIFRELHPYSSLFSPYSAFSLSQLLFSFISNSDFHSSKSSMIPADHYFPSITSFFKAQ